jgi:hypothetical protein
MAGEQEVNGGTQSVKIRPGVHIRGILGLFGGQVIQCPKYFVGFIARRLGVVSQQTHYSQIQNLYATAPIQKQIGRFDIAVNQSRLGSDNQAARNLNAHRSAFAS